MSDTKTTSSGGIGFCGLLAIVFITLKLGIGNTAAGCKQRSEMSASAAPPGAES